MEQRALVALSGGIDSAAVVLMMRERGFRVTGLYIDMLGDSTLINKAADVAQRLGIELVVENVADEFREKIINHTINEHLAGRTPSPCVRCNPLIKWEVARRVADRLGIFYIATGHYVRVIDGYVCRGVDPVKDQSYYLWQLSDALLERAITPLGDFTKKQVREFLARQSGFEDLAAGGESMSICFVGKRSYEEFLREKMSISKGLVVDLNSGRVRGDHDGFQLYTAGQKRGFTGGGAVVRVEAGSNTIVVSDKNEDLYTDSIVVEDYVLKNFGADEVLNVCVRGLGRNPQSPIIAIRKTNDERLEINIGKKDAWAVAVGQPVVFYSGDRVVGGGYVCTSPISLPFSSY